MEALLIVLGEAVVGITIACLVLSVEFVLTILIELLFHGGLWLLQRKANSAEMLEPEAAAAGDRRARVTAIGVWRRRLLWVTGGLLGLTVLGFIAVSTVLFEPTLRLVFRSVAKNTGVVIEFENANINLFTGQFGFENAKFVRTASGPSRFDLSAQQARVDFNVWELLRGQARFEEIVIVGLRGEFHRLELTEKIETRRDFVIDRLQLTDVRIQIVDETPEHADVAAEVVIETWNSQPIRSQFALFDILFRTDHARGQINGAPFSIQTEIVGQERTTRWQAERLPLHLVGPYIGQPLRWLKTAEVDLQWTDRSTLLNPQQRNLDYQLNFQGVTLEAPENLPPIARAALEPLFEVVRKNTKSIPLKFQLQADERDFEAKLSLGATGLSQAVTAAVTQTFAETTGIASEEIRDAGEKVLDFFRDRIKRRRQLRENQGDTR